MPKIFHVTVKALIVVDEKVLLLKKPLDDGSFYWDAPGGRVDAHETPDQTLVRELGEELPTLGDYTPGGVVHTTCVQQYEKQTPDIGLYFVFMRVDAKPFEVSLSDEHAGYQWFSKGQMRELVQYKDSAVKKSYHEALTRLFA